MFLNKTKEQLGPEKTGAPSFSHSSASSTSSPHYPTAVLAIPGSVEAGGGVRVVPKQEGSVASAGGGGGSNSGNASLSVVGGHLHQSHTSQNITVVPVPSTGIMTAGEWPFLTFHLLACSLVLCHFHVALTLCVLPLLQMSPFRNTRLKNMNIPEFFNINTRT